MFAPKVAKPHTRVTASSTSNLAHQRSTVVARRPSYGSVEEALLLQRTIGNQGTLRLLAQRASTLIENEPPGGHEHEADPENMTARKATRGIARDFSKIPIFPPDRENQPEARSSLSAPRLPSVIQPKLAVGEVNDPLEHEADRVADQVMRMPAPNVSITAAPPRLSRDCTACGEEAQTLQTRPAGASVNDGGDAPRMVHEVLRSPGQPLSAVTRAFMEPRFGRDFSHVRVHADAKAAESARLVNARAYTVGQDVVFAAEPDTHVGRTTLAHELAHVIQQSGARNRLRRRPAGALDQEQGRSGSTAPVTDMPVSAQGAPETGGSAGGAPKLDIEFNAFIPGSLGNSFESYEHPTDLKNQPTFDAAIKAVSGTWLQEPGSFSAAGTGPWYYATDYRPFGGGSHRVGFKGSVSRLAIGSLAGASPLFAHDTSGSAHVRWTHTGYFTSKDETGSLEGPISKAAGVSQSENRVDIDATESRVTTIGSSAYPFKATSPDIDYTVMFDLKKDPAGKTAVSFEVANNLFPYYELLINGGTVWTYTSSSTGPGLFNLNRSVTFKSGIWYF